MESPLQRKLKLIKQPQLENVCQRMLKFRHLAPIVVGVLSGGDPAMLQYVEIASKLADGANELLDAREQERTDRNLAEVASIVSAMQQATYNTYEHVVSSISFASFETLRLMEATYKSNTFWEVAERELKLDKAAIGRAIKELRSVGLVTMEYGFEHADKSWQNYPDINWAMNYAESLAANLRAVVKSEIDSVRDDLVKRTATPAERAFMSSLPPAESEPDPALASAVRIGPWRLQELPRLTLSGFYLLELIAILVDALNQETDRRS